jgi:hypothetical protein
MKVLLVQFSVCSCRFVLDRNIYLGSLLFNALDLCFPQNVRDQVLDPDKILVPHVLIFLFCGKQTMKQRL